jgi:hypothetical protein
MVWVKECLCDSRSFTAAVKEGVINHEQNHPARRDGDGRHHQRQVDDHGGNLRAGPNHRAGDYGRNMSCGDYGRNQCTDVHMNPRRGVTLTVTRGSETLVVVTKVVWKRGMTKWRIERWIHGRR